jgi:hypothetical protein
LLFISICFNIVVSIMINDFEESITGDVFYLFFRRISLLLRGTLLSLAWTVRSCRRRRFRRTKVLLHFMHLKGRSLVCDLLCLLRCLLRLKARLQNWHLYFFWGADVLAAEALIFNLSICHPINVAEEDRV